MIILENEQIREADHYIDENHATFSELGRRFFQEFHYDTGNNRISSQIRNLQQITCSATRFADIEDFVKNQMGKEKMGKRTPWKALGREVLQQLEQLRAQSEEFDDEPGNQMALRLRLARGWVRAVVSEYLYRVARHQMGETT